MLPRLLNQEGNTSSAIEREAITWLDNAIEALPQPWIALASKRQRSTDGPTWVRYVVLHPDKGIALVDTDDAEPAVAPLDDFLWHTGFAALQDSALCIVAVTITADTVSTVADRIETAFGGSPCGLANPNWCEAVVDLLLATPELMLTRSRPTEPAVATAPSIAWSGEAVREPYAESSVTAAPSALSRERWRAAREPTPPQPTWRSWPVSPVAAAMALLALGTVVLISHEASPPANEIAHARPAAVVASAAPPAPPVSPVVNAPSPGAAAALPPPVATPASAPLVNGAFAKILPVRTAAATRPKKAAPRTTAEQGVRLPVTPSMPAPPSQQIASANTTRAVCADVLHPDLPGGWQYRGPPVPGCLPIRFFGLIGMR